MHCDENLIDELQLGENHGVGGQSPSNRNSMFGVSREMHRPLLSMPPIVLMGAPGTGGMNAVTPSPIVEMPPSPAPNQMMIVEFPCETLEGVLNSEDLMDDDQAIIDGEDDDDTDMGEEDLEDDSYFVEGAIEVSRERVVFLTDWLIGPGFVFVARYSLHKGF